VGGVDDSLIDTVTRQLYTKERHSRNSYHLFIFLNFVQ